MSEAERVVAARLVAVLRAELDRPAKSTPEETLAVIQARRLLDRVGGRSESLLAMRRLSARGRGGAR